MLNIFRIRKWLNQPIRQRKDGYFSGTDMASATGTPLNKWCKLPETQTLLGVAAFFSRLPRTEVVQMIKTGNPVDQGTWLHPQVAFEFAGHCSLKLQQQISSWTQEQLIALEADSTTSAEKPEKPEVLKTEATEVVVPEPEVLMPEVLEPETTEAASAPINPTQEKNNMTNLIQSQVADNVELIYLKDRDVAGIHIRGLATMLGCNQSAVWLALKGVQPEHVFDAEMQTGGGLQGVQFILEKGVVQLLKTIRRGNYKQETKDAAEDLYDRFAEAGFKLYAMFQAAPEELAAKFTPTPDQTETPEVLKFTGAELDEMLKQAKLMQVLATSGNFKLRNAVRQNLEIQWGLEPTKELEFPRIVSSDISNKELAYQWFLDSNNPDQHWHVPSGEQITITNLHKKFTSYCEIKGTTALKKTVFSKALVDLGFKRIESNYTYFILPHRPA